MCEFSTKTYLCRNCFLVVHFEADRVFCEEEVERRAREGETENVKCLRGCGDKIIRVHQDECEKCNPSRKGASKREWCPDPRGFNLKIDEA
ncbi:hypothetical protein FZEAL_3893 [Fusarium zealandicum]|uniref:Uncharacterized protein n=1 Tax=Fusarium zealandicum TaxID=1053134 RepID=A0A8H4XLD7_9HYPO|nr:hypothetical protein FZEAL_3893 [Fusarium zealandicum]